MSSERVSDRAYECCEGGPLKAKCKPCPRPLGMTGLDPAALERAAKAIEKRVQGISWYLAEGLAEAALEASGLLSVVAEQQQELSRGEAHREELIRDVEAWRARVHTLEEALKTIASWDEEKFPEDGWRMVATAREALGMEAQHEPSEPTPR